MTEEETESHVNRTARISNPGDAVFWLRALLFVGFSQYKRIKTDGNVHPPLWLNIQQLFCSSGPTPSRPVHRGEATSRPVGGIISYMNCFY